MTDSFNDVVPYFNVDWSPMGELMEDTDLTETVDQIDSLLSVSVQMGQCLLLIP
jgi:hypothetical protein